MEIIHELKDPFPHLIVENMYNEEELALIWQELEFLNNLGKFKNPDEYGAAKFDGEYSTSSKGIILDNVYYDRSFSNILNINRKLFKHTETYSNLSPYHFKFLVCNIDSTKLRYYSNKDYYRPHRDYNSDTIACTYFYKKPKKFSGGELFFPEYNYQIECLDNTCIIFPSYFNHGVKEVTITDKNYCDGFGRYCMTQFTNVVEKND